MLNKINLVIAITLLLNLKAESLISSAVDTIEYLTSAEYLQLNHNFIIQSSLEMSKNDSSITPKNINFIEGKIYLKNSDQGLYIVKYDYLVKDLPLHIGPKWKSLPSFNQIFINEKNSKINIDNVNTKNRSEIFSSGNIFRSISLSPLGGNDFTGGLQMQINGSIADNIDINAILTDQSLLFQPEGTTNELENFDKISINISHPNFLLNAGDIEYNSNDKFNNINRKLVGAQNEFEFNDWSGSFVYANSNGNFNTLEIKGRDGDQGPYDLIGKNGNHDIIILAGTEKVWFNGKKLKRGENYDYTIDYSLADLYFTPEVMVDFDSDIYIEYQYSDFDYQKGFQGITLSKNLEQSNHISFGFFNEFDQFNKEELGEAIIDSFSMNKGSSIFTNTAYLDSTGNYFLEDSIYIFSTGSINENSQLYRVNFYSNPRGNYKKTISVDNEIFYEYVPFNERSNYTDLYSPFFIKTAPKSHQFSFIALNFDLHQNVAISGQVSGSNQTDNRITKNENIKSGSYIFNLDTDTLEFGVFNLKFAYKEKKSNPNYLPLGRENNIMHSKLWNLNEIIENNSKENLMKADIGIKNFGISTFESARLLHDRLNLSRFSYNQSIAIKNFSNSFFNYNYINDENNKTYYRLSSRIERSSLKYSPYVLFDLEQNNLSHRYQKIGSGLKYITENSNIESGFNLRIDKERVINPNWSLLSEDIIFHTNIKSQLTPGFNKNIVYKKRIKNNQYNRNFNYSLLGLSISWKNWDSPINANINIRKEETLSRNSAIIYEFIGPGLGEFRFDSDFNTYVPDTNGDYIAYSTIIGDKVPNTVFEGSQNFIIDFSKIKLSPNIIIRSNSKQEFRGSGDLSFIRGIDDETLTKLYLYSRLEAIISQSRSTKFWFQYFKNIDGYDPRGNDLHIEKQFGFDKIVKINDNLSFQVYSNIHKNFIQSNISDIRNRHNKGTWNNFTLKNAYQKYFNFDLGIILGLSDGRQFEQEFKATALGLKSNINVFLHKKGRIISEFIYINANENNGYSVLQPEALNGYSIGNNIRTNTRIQYIFNKTVSLNINLNTINDSRYDNLVALRGEMRANF